VPSLQFTARLLAGSPEYNTLVSQTTGTATLSVQHDAGNSVTFSFPQMAFQMAENAEADGIVAVTVTGAPQYNTTQNTAFSVTTLCGISGILMETGLALTTKIGIVGASVRRVDAVIARVSREVDGREGNITALINQDGCLSLRQEGLLIEALLDIEAFSFGDAFDPGDHRDIHQVVPPRHPG
jgi:hypothetical protein